MPDDTNRINHSVRRSSRLFKQQSQGSENFRELPELRNFCKLLSQFVVAGPWPACDSLDFNSTRWSGGFGMLSKPATSKSSRVLKDNPSDPTPEKRRRLSTKQKVSDGPIAIDPWCSSGSLEKCFPGLTGAALIEKIFDTFGDPRGEYVDFPWFQPDGRETVVSDPCNRPLQQSTVAEYEQRLFSSGLASDCSGPLVIVFAGVWGSGVGMSGTWLYRNCKL